MRLQSLSSSSSDLQTSPSPPFAPPCVPLSSTMSLMTTPLDLEALDDPQGEHSVFSPGLMSDIALGGLGDELGDILMMEDSGTADPLLSRTSSMEEDL